MLLLIVCRGLSQGQRAKNFCKLFLFSKNFSHGRGRVGAPRLGGPLLFIIFYYILRIHIYSYARPRCLREDTEAGGALPRSHARRQSAPSHRT